MIFHDIALVAVGARLTGTLSLEIGGPYSSIFQPKNPARETLQILPMIRPSYSVDALA